jgi:anti-anti-sigma factor
MSQRLILTSEQTIYQAAELHQSVRDALSRDQGVEVDLSHVTELDSAGVQVLIWLQREGQRRALPVKLLDPSDEVLALCDTLGLNDTLSFTEADA